ncbi:carbohydrate-binding protein [Actinoplanes sp. NPDC024001]|uniref:carbohydrate-binding protein n=1 Tax=Actinoplanes sp. NPDC024001 TaxID=3154598 RepID=UPI0033D3646C
MKRTRLLLAAAVFVSGFATLSVTTGRDVPARAADTVSRTVLTDDFGGARGAVPDATRWLVTGDPRQAWQSGEGQLVLSTLLRSREPFGQAAGRVEARIRMEREGGAWRALGVLTEQGQLPAGQVEVLADDQVGGGDFHTYAIDWTRTSMVWSVDGRDVLRFTPAVAGAPFLVALNTAAGGQRSQTLLVDDLRVSTRVTVDATTWKTYVRYRPGQYVRYQGKLYRVRELHTSLPGWQPTLTPAIFQKV